MDDYSSFAYIYLSTFLGRAQLINTTDFRSNELRGGGDRVLVRLIGILLDRKLCRRELFENSCNIGDTHRICNNTSSTIFHIIKESSKSPECLFVSYPSQFLSSLFQILGLNRMSRGLMYIGCELNSGAILTRILM